MEALNRQVAFGPRVPDTAAHDACRDYLVSELKKTADSVQVQHFEHRRIVHPSQYRATLRLTKTQPIPTTGTLPMDNIVAVINGTDGKPPKLLLCAHWDSRPTADQEESADDRLKPIAGANDGASGVAVLLELSRVLHAKRPAQGVILALFDGEDLGPDLGDMLLGAKYYAKNPVPNKPAEGILLDMIGDSDLAIYKEGYSLDANRTLTDTIFAAAGKLGYSKQFVSEVKYTMQDDHVPLILAGIPTVDLIDFDYPYWHTLKDTPERCSPASLEAVGKTLAAVVYERKAVS
jgi:Zn-dependent M28 family amino/carboxypeptidase